jgi:hypothetical protein
MDRGAWRHVAWRLGLVALVGLAPIGAARAADPYPTMAPIGEYLMGDRAAEIALARSAAPPSISADAEVLVLEAKGYTVAVPGKNGFVCLVERAWFAFQDDEFWNPKLRGPDCYNPEAARSVLPTLLTRTRWALSGLSMSEMARRTRAALAAGKIPRPEIGAMNFMMSRDGYLGDGPHGPWHPHLMFYLPPSVHTSDWGANLPGAHVVGADATADPYTMFYVPVATWSDGTPDAAADAHHGT